MSDTAEKPSRWHRWHDKVGTRPPRDTLLKALDNWEAEHGAGTTGFGVDLGCGEGRDTVEFLRRGWRVLGIDFDQHALDLLNARTDLPKTGTLETLCAPMEDAPWDGADIVSSSFALPFVPPGNFPRLWDHIVASLNPGGRFATQFLGPKDGWASPQITVVTRAELDALLAPFEVEWLEEEDHPGASAKGKPKHWHLFHVVARKPAEPRR